MDIPLFKAVIFDMDGLMFDTEKMARVVWQSAANDMGHEITDKLFLSLIGRRREDTEAMMKAAFGPDFSIQTLRERLAVHWEQQMRQQGIPQKPGLIPLMEFLDSVGLKKAVATSSHKENALGKLGLLLNRFDVLVTGNEVTRGKPAPDIFLLAAQRLGLKAGECLVLEDSPTGIQAAEVAGMYAIMVPDLVPAPENVRHACSSLVEVHAWLKMREKPVG